MGLTAENIAIELAHKFKEIRTNKGLSHDKLAIKAGLNRSTISLIESGKRIPTIVTCLKISDALEVFLADLLQSIIYNKNSPLNK